jgi:hypothetical protein
VKLLLLAFVIAILSIIVVFSILTPILLLINYLLSPVGIIILCGSALLILGTGMVYSVLKENK